MTDLRQAAMLALKALEDLGMKHHENTGETLHADVYTALRTALEQQAERWCMKANGCKTECGNCPNFPSPQQQAEPVSIYYMRDNHTFKELSADVSTALVEIESEFNAGYTYGSLCSKREGFPKVHASGYEHRLVFFWECKTVLEKWIYTPPQQQAEPVAKLFGTLPVYDTTPPQQQAEQEPVATVTVMTQGVRKDYSFQALQKLPDGVNNLYTTPPQRQWVGLTHEQTKECLQAWDENDAYALCRAIEAKLKEKNNG